MIDDKPALIQINGDLIEMFENNKIDIIVHGCNCLGVMGNGIAKTLRQVYPDVFAADLTLHEYYKNNEIELRSKLGTFEFVPLSLLNRGVINAYTQFSPSNTQDVFEYKSFERICNNIIKSHGGEIFGFPYIGMGLANGDPDRILPILAKFAQKNQQLGGKTYLVKYLGQK